MKLFHLKLLIKIVALIYGFTSNLQLCGIKNYIKEKTINGVTQPWS